MRSTRSISVIRGTDRGTAFVDAADGSLWYVSLTGSVRCVASSGVSDVQLGVAHGVVLFENGSVGTFFTPERGSIEPRTYEKRGQFGTGSPGPEPAEALGLFMTGMTDVISIAATDYSSLLVDVKGRLWCSGANDHNEFGVTDPRGSYYHTSEDSFVHTLDGVTAVTAGPTHAFLTLADGEIAFVGQDRAFVGGLSDVATSTRDAVVRTGLKDVTIVTSECRSYALRPDNTVLYTGLGYSGRRSSSAPPTYHCPPARTWREAPGLLVSTLVPYANGEAIALSPDGEVLICGDTQKWKFDVWMHDRHHFYPDGNTAQGVALTHDASFLRQEDGWFACHPGNPHAGLCVREQGERPYKNGYTPILHPADWEFSSSLREIGLSDIDAARALEALV